MGSCLSLCSESIKKYCESGDTSKVKKDKVKRERKYLGGIADTVAVWDTIVPVGQREMMCPICNINKMIMTVRKEKKGEKTEGVWEIGHIKAFAEGGNEDIENLRPICKKCNRAMGKTHMKQYCINKVPTERLEETLRLLRL